MLCHRSFRRATTAPKAFLGEGRDMGLGTLVEGQIDHWNGESRTDPHLWGLLYDEGDR